MSMERLPRGNHVSHLPGQVPPGSSSPNTKHATSFSYTIPMSSTFHSPMPNFKIKIASPTTLPDHGSNLFGSTERPQKRRKMEEQVSRPVIRLNDDDDGEEDDGREENDSGTPYGTQQSAASSASKTTSEDSSLPPFPARRPRVARASRMRRRAPPRESLTNDNIVYGPPPAPENATRYPEGLGDYFQWHGSHNEDLLTETGIRSGHFEKVPNLPVELGSSRHPVLSALKMKGGINALSKLMGVTLARRGEIASVVSQNNFRPPPRVTLTDTRREAWLKELASNDVPLRRLSKTIPHGIRGKPLLEQCLLKSVPVWRAIWLIKCVGSNEIRAFRKRGCGGSGGGSYPCSSGFSSSSECKWVREWTESVVDTVTSLVCDSMGMKTNDLPQWQQNLLYMLTLVRSIYEEQLLDRDAFHGGLISSFKSAKVPDAMVTWMAILAPYAADMAKYCQRGRQFLDALLDKALTLTGRGFDSRLGGLLERCTSLITDLLRRKPQCAVLPKTWQSYRDLISTFLSDDDNDGVDEGGILARRIRRIDQQNAIVDKATQLDLDRESPRPVTAVISLCNKRGHAFEPSKLLASCQRLIPDPATLAETFVAWAIDASRPGFRSIYATVRLLRLLHKSGFDAQEQISVLLDSATIRDPESTQRFYRLVVELVRSKHFSVSKYLQRRMVRGVLSIRKEHLEILAHLPPQAISPEVINLAASLCEHAGCSFMVTPTEIQFAASKLDGLFLKSGSSNGAFAAEAQAFVGSLSPNMRHALALHVRKEIVSRRDQQAYPSPDDHHHMDVDSSSVYAPPHAVITILELVEDYPLFVDVLLLIVPACNSQALRIVVHCTMCHQDVFQAIGALEHLYKSIMKRYASIYQQEARDRDLVLALIDLMSTVSGSERAVSILQGHLALIVPENVGIAPSPVSDQMVDVLQSQELRSLADLENILQSGNVLDETVLQKMLKFLFRALMSKCNDTGQIVGVLKILACVQNLYEEAFDRMFNQWLDQMFTSDDMRIAIQIVPWVIAGGMVSIPDIVNRVREKVLGCSGDKKVWVTGLAPNVFVAALKPPRTEFLGSIEHYYRLKTAQAQFISKEPALFVSLAGYVLEATSSTNDAVAKRARQLSASSLFESLFLTSLCSANTEEPLVVDELRRLSGQGLPIASLLARVLRCDVEHDEIGVDKTSALSRNPRIEVIRRVASKVNDFNMVPCRVLTQLELHALQNELSTMERDSVYKQAVQALLDPSVSAWRKHGKSWSHLLIDISPDLVASLHSTVLDELLSHVHQMLQGASITDAVSDEETSQQLLSIIEATESYLAESQLLEAFDKIQSVFRHFAALIDNTDMLRNFSFQVRMMTTVLLRLLGAHLRAPHETSIPQEKLFVLCFILAKCLTALSDLQATRPESKQSEPATTTISSSQGAAADLTVEGVLVYVSSLLSSDMRNKCLSMLHTQLMSVDPRVDFILGRDDPRGSASQYLLMIEDSAANNGVGQTRTDPAGPETPGTLHRAVGLSGIRMRPYSVDPWETLQDSTSIPGSNDTCLDLSLFGTRKVVL